VVCYEDEAVCYEDDEAWLFVRKRLRGDTPRLSPDICGNQLRAMIVLEGEGHVGL